MEIRCQRCNRFFIQLDFNEKSDQDFTLKRYCDKCGHQNIFYIKINKDSEASAPPETITINY